MDIIKEERKFSKKPSINNFFTFNVKTKKMKTLTLNQKYYLEDCDIINSISGASKNSLKIKKGNNNQSIEKKDYKINNNHDKSISN